MGRSRGYLFGAKLPGGIVQGIAEAPNKVANAITGIEADENGKVRQLNGVPEIR